MKIWILIILFFFISCAGTRILHQGVRGQVIWMEGNRMPGPGKTASPGQPVIRILYFYKATENSQATSEDGIFYHDIKTRLVKKIKSDSSGHYSLNLPAGTYSVFVGEEKGLYANSLDNRGLINPVEVKKNQVTSLNIRIDYKAYY